MNIPSFNNLARKITDWSGSMWASILAISTILIWFLGGFILGFSDSYQIIINIGTTCVTYIMVFLIQNSQNRDNKALHLKLDELLYSKSQADNSLINVECLSDKELEEISKKYLAIAEVYKNAHTKDD